MLWAVTASAHVSTMSHAIFPFLFFFLHNKPELVAMLAAAAVATPASTSGPVPRHTPQFPPSWDVKQSTWVMACNYSGLLSPDITASWGVVNK